MPKRSCNREREREKPYGAGGMSSLRTCYCMYMDLPNRLYFLIVQYSGLAEVMLNVRVFLLVQSTCPLLTLREERLQTDEPIHGNLATCQSTIDMDVFDPSSNPAPKTSTHYAFVEACTKLCKKKKCIR